MSRRDAIVSIHAPVRGEGATTEGNMKYKFTGEIKLEFGITLRRIARLDTGEVGGWVEGGSNLDTSGNAWVSGNAQVSGDARVYGNAWVSDDAQVSGNAWVSGNTWVFGDA